MNSITYSVISSNDLSKVDFNQINDTDEDTIIKSADGSECIIEYSTTPTFITDGSVATISILDHAGALALVRTEDWTQEMPI